MKTRTLKVWVVPEGRWLRGDIPRRAWIWKDDNGIGVRVRATITFTVDTTKKKRVRRLAARKR